MVSFGNGMYVGAVNTTNIEESGGTLEHYFLEQNFPNPFNPSTVIRFQLPANSHVTLKVFDALGRQVATLVDGKMAAGYHAIPFKPDALASGIYFYQLTTGQFSQVRKAILLK